MVNWAPDKLSVIVPGIHTLELRNSTIHALGGLRVSRAADNVVFAGGGIDSARMLNGIWLISLYDATVHITWNGEQFSVAVPTGPYAGRHMVSVAR